MSEPDASNYNDQRGPVSRAAAAMGPSGGRWRCAECGRDLGDNVVEPATRYGRPVCSACSDPARPCEPEERPGFERPGFERLARERARVLAEFVLEERATLTATGAAELARLVLELTAGEPSGAALRVELKRARAVVAAARVVALWDDCNDDDGRERAREALCEALAEFGP